MIIMILINLCIDSLNEQQSPATVVSKAIQANYLQVAPGELHLAARFIILYTLKIICVELMCTVRLYWRLWETNHKS